MADRVASPSDDEITEHDEVNMLDSTVYPPMMRSLDETVPTQEQVVDLAVVERDFPEGQGKFEALHNSQLSRSLMSGSYTFESGSAGQSRYDGTFLNDPAQEAPKAHGQGVRKNADGSIHSGQWKNGFLDGPGEWKAPPPSCESYTGEWKRGKKHGFGIQKFENGDVYDGDWANGYFQDRGKYTYANGDQFCGIWEAGIKAHGSFYFRDGRISRRTYQNGRLMTCQDFDPRKRSYLPTITRGEAHDPMRNSYGAKQVSAKPHDPVAIQPPAFVVG